MKLTRRQLRSLILESLEEEISGNETEDDPQNLSYFGEGIVLLSKTRDIDKMEENHQAGWLAKNCGFVMIGQGGFRNVFHLDNMPEYAVKVAYTYSDSYEGMGNNYNKTEIEVFNKHPEIFPRVYVYDQEQYNWYVLDRLVPISSSEELGRVAINAYTSFKTISQDVLTQHEYVTASEIEALLGELLNSCLVKVGPGKEGYKFSAQDMIKAMKEIETFAPSYIDAEYGAAYPALSGMLSDPVYQRKFINDIESDQKFLKFFIVANDLGLNDLGMQNVGTNAAGDKLLVLDHSA